MNIDKGLSRFLALNIHFFHFLKLKRVLYEKILSSNDLLTAISMKLNRFLVKNVSRRIPVARIKCIRVCIANKGQLINTCKGQESQTGEN